MGELEIKNANIKLFKDYLINKFWCTKSKWYHKGRGHFNWEHYQRVLKAKIDEIVYIQIYHVLILCINIKK